MSNLDFNTRAASWNSPASRFTAVTPDDTADLPDGPCRALYVTGAGAVAVVDARGAVTTFESGPAQYHPLRVHAVRAAGTTAQGIIALY